MIAKDIYMYSLSKYIRNLMFAYTYFELYAWYHNSNKRSGSRIPRTSTVIFCTHWPLGDLLWYSVTSRSKFGFFMFPATHWKSVCTSGTISRYVLLDLCCNGNPHWKSEKSSGYNTQISLSNIYIHISKVPGVANCQAPERSASGVSAGN